MSEKNFLQVYRECQEIGMTDPAAIALHCWNEGYHLGRRRWYWGPWWFVTFQGWLNTQLAKLRKLP